VLALTLADLKAMVWDLLLTDSSDPKWTAALVTRLLNRANDEWVTKTHAIETSAAVTIVAGTDEYALPTDFLKDVALFFGNEPLERQDFRNRPEIDATNDGTPTLYYVWAGKLYIYPGPVAVKSCTLYYLGMPTAMAEDADTPGWDPAPFHQALAFHAASTAKKAEGDLALSQTYLGDYARVMAEYRSYMSSRTAGTMPKMRMRGAW
jgi:hypothetical protein